MVTSKKIQPPASVQNFPIVGIGASAGGLDAFKSLLKAIPEDSGMAFVLVQHLDPSHESILPEILQRVTKIPVLEITDDIHLAPNHIYVIPSNKMLISTDGVLKLSDRAKKINLSIDVFFTSLADVHKECAVGVVLSGTGSDGTLGLKAIKEHGGISIAQDPESSAYDGMPQSAINAGVVDFILSPEKIPSQLSQINSTYKSSHIYKVEEEELPKGDEVIFRQILSLLRQRSGVDFTYYKQPTFHRRIARRVAISKKKDLTGYLKFLRSDKAEQDLLFQDVLIPVTSFFRDPKTFELLSDTVFPELFKNKANHEPIRMWIAGCSTGEEAYSIAICLHEFLTKKSPYSKIQIFASDISEIAIKKARTAIYTKADVEKLSVERLKNYFIKNNGGYEVKKLIRDLCVFAPHNFLKDPPFAKMDLISCRNVLIYMDTFLQKKALTVFHYALNENGFLLLGKSESTNHVSELFSPIEKHEKIYSRKPLPGRFMQVATNRKEEALITKATKVTKQEAIQTDFRKSAEAMLLSRYTPASVIVNEQMDIVHIHGIIAPFLEQPPGKPTFNLLKMAREGLAFELRNALHKAKKTQDTVSKENILVKTNGKQSLVTIEIIPLTDTVDIHYLILFTKNALPAVEEKSKSASQQQIKNSDVTQKRNEQLEKELASTREDMRSVTEDMEAANEELQSANEELQSSNEEMQSLNEEMETSKEEIQSTNEELTIVNQELIDKQEQLNTSRLYSDSIVTTLRHPLIVLDNRLRIKTANASFYKKFNAEEHDTEGELFYEIQNRQWDDAKMRSLLEKILPKEERLVDYEIILKFPSLGERHMLMNGLQIKNEKTAESLILLAIEDITEKKIAEKRLQESEAKFRQFLYSSPFAIYSCDNDGYIMLYNKAAVELWGCEPKPGKDKWCGSFKIFNLDETLVPHDECPMSIVLKGGKAVSTELIIERPDGTRKNIVQYPNLIYDSDEKINGAINIVVDTTEQVNIRNKIEASAALDKEATSLAEKAIRIAEDAVKSKQQFLSNMSHEIRTPMNAIIGFTKVLFKTDLAPKQKEYLSAIKTSGDAMIVLINDILDLAKVNTGKMTFTQTPFNLDASITTMLYLFETKVQEKNLELVKEYDHKIPKVLLGDPVRLHQIILNLVSNAVKFTAHGKITVVARLLNEETEKVTIEFTVTDTGIGIEKNKIKNIYTDFEQVYTDTSRAYGGTGLGLAIVKELVEKQGGTISVKSKINEGSVFSVVLHFQKTNVEIESQNEAIALKPEIKTRKILVVEDVKLNQLLMRILLDDFGFKYDFADNGKIAIEKLEAETYDIILMDLQMPKMNGFEATEHIRNKLNSKIPIIALTADVTTADLEKCKAVGMNDYISKPVDEKILYNKIVGLLVN